MTIDKIIANRLVHSKKTLAVAESCTGGLLSHRLTNRPGCSLYFLGGVICYDNSIKMKLLGVHRVTLKKFGAVSSQTSLEMARGIRRSFDSDWAIAITGIAGPTGGTPQKPIGLTYIAISSRQRTFHKRYVFTGSRLQIKSQAVIAALGMLGEAID